jgi:tRNA(fMet)-specific endonuclease VapC
MILDTAFLIDLMKGNRMAEQKLTALLQSGSSIAITAPTIFELFNGLAQSSKPAAELAKIHGVLHQQVRWTFDDASAEQGGRIYGELVRKGQPIDTIDAMIAGIALRHQEPVLTKNIKHFSRVSGLKVETY